MGTVLTVENTMNLTGHKVAFLEVLQDKYGLSNISCSRGWSVFRFPRACKADSESERIMNLLFGD